MFVFTIAYIGFCFECLADNQWLIRNGAIRRKRWFYWWVFFKYKVLCREDNNHLKNHQANDPKKQTIRNCHAHHFRSEIYKSVDDLQVIEVTSDKEGERRLFFNQFMINPFHYLLCANHRQQIKTWLPDSGLILTLMLKFLLKFIITLVSWGSHHRNIKLNNWHQDAAVTTWTYWPVFQRSPGIKLIIP